jgi:hypothetical protein
MKVGCEIAYGMIKPGVTGRDVTEAVIDGMKKAGFPGFVICTPHSVGLEHTDHPLPIGPQLPIDAAWTAALNAVEGHRISVGLCKFNDFLRANVVHLLANDLGDMLVHTPAEWKPGVSAWCCSANITSTHKQTVARNLGVNGVIAQCAHKQGGHFVDHARSLRFV